MEFYNKYKAAIWIIVALILLYVLFIRTNDKGETVINIFGTPAKTTTPATPGATQRRGGGTVSTTAALKYGDPCPGTNDGSGKPLCYNGAGCVDCSITDASKMSSAI